MKATDHDMRLVAFIIVRKVQNGGMKIDTQRS